ncbi:MAG: regulatory signaling modulator protein AmpE [Sinobacterium sp.]|nr:regulatory signaling modulator protein AmpE [Sinobacterium sp.]
MDFLAIIISLLVLIYAGSASRFQSDVWFEGWISKVLSFKKKTVLHFILAVSLPCLLLQIIYVTLGDLLWGSVELLLSVMVLLYSIGRGKYKSVLKKYQDLWRTQTISAEGFLAIEHELCSQSCHPTHAEVSSDSLYKQHHTMRELMFYIGFERVFAVLFWFAILGPVGALFYRLVSLYTAKQPCMGDEEAIERHALASKVLFVLEWPAARLVGLCYGVVGDFAKVMQAWLSLAGNVQMAVPLFISSIAGASLNFKYQWLSDHFISARNDAELSKFAADEVGKILALYNRSTVCMLVLVALFEIIA